MPDILSLRGRSALSEFRLAKLKQALQNAGGKINGPGGAAQTLGLNPNTLRSRMNKLGIAFGRKRSQ